MLHRAASTLTYNLLVGLSPEACMDVHGEVVQLSQRAHVAEQQHDDASALNCLYCARQQVWRQGLEILQTESNAEVAVASSHYDQRLPRDADLPYTFRVS